MDRFSRHRRQLTNILWASKSGLSRHRPNALLITHPIRICESQIFPFYFFRDQLLRELDFDFREISLSKYEQGVLAPVTDAKFVFFQPWWDVSLPNLKALLGRIRHENPDAKIIFLDSYAPADLRLAQYAAPYVDVYVKKHVFRDRSRYGMPTRGDTNLVDYYGRLYGLEYEEVLFPVPGCLLEKLVVGPTFSTAQHLLPHFYKQQQFDHDGRTIDLHARLGGGGNGWYGMMRDHARRVVRDIRDIKSVGLGAVDHRRYMNELRSSKICFSPFGFGEVCWRDYESIMAGALLLKPDMSHIETAPDIFLPFETYIPIAWDFSDFEDKIRYILSHEEERRAIVDNAYRVLHAYFHSNGFLQHIESLLNSDGLKADPGRQKVG